MGVSPQEMEDAIVTNLQHTTGTSIHQWQQVLLEENHATKTQMKLCLKETYKLGHFQAQTIVKLFLQQSKP